MYKTAANQFATALKLSEDEERDMISINLARILIQIGKYEEAVALCKQVRCANFNSQCHLALSLFKGIEKKFLEIILSKYNLLKHSHTPSLTTFNSFYKTKEYKHIILK